MFFFFCFCTWMNVSCLSVLALLFAHCVDRSQRSRNTSRDLVQWECHGHSKMNLAGLVLVCKEVNNLQRPSVCLIQVSGKWDLVLLFDICWNTFLFFYVFFLEQLFATQLSTKEQNCMLVVTSVEGSEVRLLLVCWLHGYFELGFQHWPVLFFDRLVDDE